MKHSLQTFYDLHNNHSRIWMLIWAQLTFCERPRDVCRYFGVSRVTLLHHFGWCSCYGFTWGAWRSIIWCGCTNQSTLAQLIDITILSPDMWLKRTPIYIYITSQPEASKERIEAAQRRLAILRNDVDLKLHNYIYIYTYRRSPSRLMGNPAYLCQSSQYDIDINQQTHDQIIAYDMAIPMHLMS